MNVPLDWLKDYVKLPKTEVELTDKLTMVGHMLDKRKEVAGQVVIDLELRGNRADMFGLIGVARDMSAIFKTPLHLPKIASLPKTDPTSPLVKAESSVKGLVKRYIAVKLNVVVAPSPKWLADRLGAYGIEPINNVVDVTNYVMIETSHPMHAFDYDSLAGGTLHLRRAKHHESFDTIAQGTTLRLTAEDIAICDTKIVQCLTCIGGAASKVTEKTNTILLETAVYDAASSRRTARRHKVATESGNRHEKHQDPEELPFALARAVELLKDVANASVQGSVSDYYPNPVTALTIDFYPKTLKRLVGIEIPQKEITSILAALGFHGEIHGEKIQVTVPTFRTDILQEADIVEEIIRIYGYERIPVQTLSGELPRVSTPAHILFQEKIRIALHTLTLNEVITSSLLANAGISTFETHGKFDPHITLINAPDPEISALRPSLLPNLLEYAKHSLGYRQQRISLFEIGNIYTQPIPKHYAEAMSVGMIMGGLTPSSWSRPSQPLTFFDLKGVVEALLSQLGIQTNMKPISTHPSLSHPSLSIYVGKTIVGHIGQIDASILKLYGITDPMYYGELSVKSLQDVPSQNEQPYTIAPLYPPILEDFSFTVPDQFEIGPCITALSAIHPSIESIQLLDVYQNKRMLRVTYSNPAKTLSNEDIAPVRKKLIALAQEKFSLILKTA